MRVLVAAVLATMLTLPAGAQQLLSMSPAAPGPVPGVAGGGWTVSGKVSVGLLNLRLPPGAWLPAGIGEFGLSDPLNGYVDFTERTFLQIENGRVAAMLTLYAAKPARWERWWMGQMTMACTPQGVEVYSVSRLRTAPSRAAGADCLAVSLWLASSRYASPQNKVMREGYAAAMEHGGLPRDFVVVQYRVGTPSALAIVDLRLNSELSGLADWGGSNPGSGVVYFADDDAAHDAYLDKVVRWAEAWRPDVAAGLR